MIKISEFIIENFESQFQKMKNVVFEIPDIHTWIQIEDLIYNDAAKVELRVGIDEIIEPIFDHINFKISNKFKL